MRIEKSIKILLDRYLGSAIIISIVTLYNCNTIVISRVSELDSG